MTPAHRQLSREALEDMLAGLIDELVNFKRITKQLAESDRFASPYVRSQIASDSHVARMILIRLARVLDDRLWLPEIEGEPEPLDVVDENRMRDLGDEIAASDRVIGQLARNARKAVKRGLH